MLSLNVVHWDSGFRDHFAIHCVENAESERGSRRQDILGVLSNIDGLDSLLNWENSDSCALIGIVHADITIIRASEKEIAVKVVKHFTHWT
jgi:hypothetical protein